SVWPNRSSVADDCRGTQSISGRKYLSRVSVNADFGLYSGIRAHLDGRFKFGSGKQVRFCVGCLTARLAGFGQPLSYLFHIPFKKNLTMFPIKSKSFAR